MKKLKKIKIDDKDILFFNKRKTPSLNLIKKTYRRIHDSKKIPIMFMTRKQYLKKYITNQEKIKNIDFSPWQEKQYIKREMPFYNNVLSRYTTKRNPYFRPATVFFNDTRISPKRFKHLAFHEYGHELVERRRQKLQPFKEEMFCDKFARNKIEGDRRSKNRKKLGEAEWLTMYHGTKRKHLPEIRKEGIKPGTYFTLSKGVALGFAGKEDPVVLKTKFPTEVGSFKEEFESEVYLPHEVFKLTPKEIEDPKKEKGQTDYVWEYPVPSGRIEVVSMPKFIRRYESKRTGVKPVSEKQIGYTFSKMFKDNNIEEDEEGKDKFRLYHGTSTEGAKRILKEGLLPSKKSGVEPAWPGASEEGAIYLSTSPGAAYSYANPAAGYGFRKEGWFEPGVTKGKELLEIKIHPKEGGWIDKKTGKIVFGKEWRGEDIEYFGEIPPSRIKRVPKEVAVRKEIIWTKKIGRGLKEANEKDIGYAFQQMFKDDDGDGVINAADGTPKGNIEDDEKSKDSGVTVPFKRTVYNKFRGRWFNPRELTDEYTRHRYARAVTKGDVSQIRWFLPQHKSSLLEKYVNDKFLLRKKTPSGGYLYKVNPKAELDLSLKRYQPYHAGKRRLKQLEKEKRLARTVPAEYKDNTMIIDDEKYTFINWVPQKELNRIHTRRSYITDPVTGEKVFKAVKYKGGGHTLWVKDKYKKHWVIPRISAEPPEAFKAAEKELAHSLVEFGAGFRLEREKLDEETEEEVGKYHPSTRVESLHIAKQLKEKKEQEEITESIQEGMKNLLGDEDGDGIIAAADNDDNNSDNPSGAHWEEYLKKRGVMIDAPRKEKRRIAKTFAKRPELIKLAAGTTFGVSEEPYSYYDIDKSRLGISPKQFRYEGEYSSETKRVVTPENVILHELKHKEQEQRGQRFLNDELLLKFGPVGKFIYKSNPSEREAREAEISIPERRKEVEQEKIEYTFQQMFKDDDGDGIINVADGTPEGNIKEDDESKESVDIPDREGKCGICNESISPQRAEVVGLCKKCEDEQKEILKREQKKIKDYKWTPEFFSDEVKDVAKTKRMLDEYEQEEYERLKNEGFDEVEARAKADEMRYEMTRAENINTALMQRWIDKGKEEKRKKREEYERVFKQAKADKTKEAYLALKKAREENERYKLTPEEERKVKEGVEKIGTVLGYNVMVEEDAKEQLAWHWFGKSYYNITPKQKRQILYYIRKHAASYY